MYWKWWWSLPNKDLKNILYCRLPPREAAFFMHCCLSGYSCVLLRTARQPPLGSIPTCWFLSRKPRFTVLSNWITTRFPTLPRARYFPGTSSVYSSFWLQNLNLLLIIQGYKFFHSIKWMACTFLIYSTYIPCKQILRW